MARRHHILQNKKSEIFPDPFVKGKREDRLHKRDLSIWNANFEDPRDWDMDELSRTNYSLATYPIQEIDEYWWFAKPLITDYRFRQANSTYLNWLGYSDAEIEEWNKQYLKEGRTPLTNNTMNKIYGSPMFLREGVHHWLPLHNITFDEWNLYYKNSEPDPEELTTVLKEADESTLVDTISGNISNPYYNMWFTNPSNLPDLQKPCILRKIVCFFATEGSVRISLNFSNNTSYTEEHNTVSGRNEIDLNIPINYPVTTINLQVLKGNIKANKSKVQEGIGTITYRYDRWDTQKVCEWSLGFGIYIDAYQEWLPEEKGKWITPEFEDIMQLVGQAPINSENIFLNVMNFLGADSRKDSSPYLLPYDKYEDISGFELYSLGAKGGGYDGEKDDEKEPPLVSPIEDSYIDGSGEEINGFGAYAAMHIGEWNDLISKNTHRRLLFISGNVYGGPNIMRVDKGYTDAVQSGQVRYCAKKSDEELGYRLYIDEANDQVLMMNCPLTEVDQTKVQGLEELPKGLLRGITLRYANRKHRKVCKPLSEMRAEEQNILTYIKRYD